MIYMGSRLEAVDYFEVLGHSCPPETNPAEFFIDLVTIDTEDPAQCSIDNDRIDYLADAFHEYHGRNMVDDESNGRLVPPSADRYSNRRRGNTMTRSSLRPHERIGALLLRSIRQNIRDLKVNVLRIGTSIGLATIFSQLFSTMKRGSPIAKSIADRTALLSFGAINMAMVVLMKTLNLFGNERCVVSREQMGNQYSSFEYLISKSLAELPLEIVFSTIFAATLKRLTSLRTPLHALAAVFSTMGIAGTSLGFAIGSLTGNAEEAMTIGVPLNVILIAVGIINPSGVDASAKTPILIKALQQISPIKLAIEALCIAEFKGMEFDDGKGRWRLSGWRLKDLPRMGGLALVQNGDQVLDALGLADRSYEKVIKELLLLSGCNLLVSWFGLSFFGPKFVSSNRQTIKVPVWRSLKTNVIWRHKG